MSSKSLKDLSGKWHMNQSLSSDPAPVLELQGFNLLIRKTASKAPITLSVTQSGSKEIHITQSTTASIPAIKEEWYPEDYEWREQKDTFLGKVKSRSRWLKVGDLDQCEEFMVQGLEGGEEVVEAEVPALEGTEWRARQIWCFEGERFVRRVVTTGKDGGRVETRLVYDFEG